MLLGTRDKLSERIVLCFREKPHLNEMEIYTQLVKVKKVTHRAVFKELANLVNEGVLVRIKGRYAVKVTWVLELLNLGDELTKQSLHRSSLDLQVPRAGERLRWRFSDLKRMDTFWVQLMFVLFSISKTKRMYVWSPHFWFHLLDPYKEMQAMRAMKKGGNKHYLIIGDDSYIDQLPVRYWDKSVYEWSFAPGPFEGEARQYIDVIDDFILTVTFPPHFVEALDKLCRTVRNENELRRTDLRSFFSEKVKVSLTLENNPRKAARFSKKFKDFFGHR